MPLSLKNCLVTFVILRYDTMSKERHTIMLHESTVEELEQYISDTDNQSKSQLADNLIQHGLRRLGYDNAKLSPARQLIDRVGIGLLSVGGTLLILSTVGSVDLLGAGVAVVGVSIFFLTIVQYVVANHEPYLSNLLPTIKIEH